MKSQYNKHLQETYYSFICSNGLQVYLLPKKGFTKSYAILSTNYGSIDNHFITSDGKEHKVADGIAHFLEHKMFEKEDGDVMNKFNDLGANTNAFTSFTQTSYLFSTTNDVEEPLKLLLDFVQTPHFTEESVEKEKGIIGEEIEMYNDDAGWKNYFGAFEQMYINHPARIDIAGTKESIAEITHKDLYLCYNTFYHPSNMVLFVIGDFSEDRIKQVITKNQSQKEFMPKQLLKRILPFEPADVGIKKKTVAMDVVLNKVMIGYKLSENKTTFDFLKNEIVLEIALEILFGTSSAINETMMDRRIISEPMGYGVNFERSFANIMVSCETGDTDLFLAEYERLITDTVAKVQEDQFQAIKRKMIGEQLLSFNSLEYIANNFVKYHLNGENLFNVTQMIHEITFEEIQQVFKELQDSSRTIHVVQSIKK